MKKIKQNNDRSDRREEGFFEKRMDGQGRPEDVVFVWNDVKEHAARRAGESMFLGRENTAASNNRRQASVERAVNEEERGKDEARAGIKPRCGQLQSRCIFYYFSHTCAHSMHI